ncbi:OmpA family protein [Leptolyngbya sp. PCC 6406]|uniref:OmpA family protein n=1 Tax=Leptolyngbya sp. PCC 6406 TaxID=1173264 RepID=UPI0002AC2D33|nr:hypothetical protein [Leptolyngbya sp. PCC 6406]
MAELPPLDNSVPSSQPAPVGAGSEGLASVAAPVPGRWQGVRSLLVWSLRWAALGLGVGGAWMVGLLVAQYFPANSPNLPLSEGVVRRSQRFSQKLRRLPDWWAGEERQPAAVPSATVRDLPAATSPRPITLTDSQREQITTELDAIETDLQRLRDRTSALEIQLGLPTLSAPIEGRLATVNSRLFPATEAEGTAVLPQGLETPAPPSSPASTPPPVAPAIHPLLQLEAYRVTLPSDVLFTGGEAIFQPNAAQLLDSILGDVGRYPGATILVGSYTDAKDDNAEVALSFQQALAVQRYLATRLGEGQYHWITVGYGNSSLGTRGSSPLTRRIAIAIVPPS